MKSSFRYFYCKEVWLEGKNNFKKAIEETYNDLVKIFKKLEINYE